jgi:hypothetical protein
VLRELAEEIVQGHEGFPGLLPSCDGEAVDTTASRLTLIPG